MDMAKAGRLGEWADSKFESWCVARDDAEWMFGPRNHPLILA
jgi:hypothetical protein